MQHPFDKNQKQLLDSTSASLVCGGTKLSTNPFCGDDEIKPALPPSPPIYYTQALGEDGGDFPLPDLT